MVIKNCYVQIISIACFIILLSCGKDDSNSPSGPSISNIPSALLGEEIVIDGENFELNKLQVFFDNEESFVNYVTDKKIKVRVPRTLDRYNPRLRVVDLNTNTNIVDEVFLLKEPKITGFEQEEITFDEPLVILGENFDSSRDFVEVKVNGEPTFNVLNASYDRIEVYLPYAITDKNLVVTVTAQLQDAVSNSSLILKRPEILESSESYYTGGDLVITGSNFNPDRNMGKIYFDGVESYISSASKEELRVRTPLGPYDGFNVKEFTYQLAGYEVVYELNMDILNNSIMVDPRPEYFQSRPIVYNNKAYAYFIENETGFGFTYTLYEFTPETQQWSRLNGTSFNGYLDRVVYNQKGEIYSYRAIGDNTRKLYKTNLNDLSESEIALPFDDNRYQTVSLHYQDKFYIINGEYYDGFSNLPAERDYVYDENTQTWSELTSGPMLDNFENFRYLFDDPFLHNGILYFNYSPQSGITKGYRLLPDLTMETYDSMFHFAYKEAIIIQYQNGPLNNFFNDKPGIRYRDVQGSNYFIMGEEIYFEGETGNQVSTGTYKLKKEVLDEIF